MGNLFVPAIGIVFNAIAPVQVTQAAGGAGWVTDVDCSGTLPAGCAGKVGVWRCTANVADASVQAGGVRSVDDSADVKITQVGSIGTGYETTMLAKISSDRKVDLYRAAADNYYHLLGYFS